MMPKVPPILLLLFVLSPSGSLHGQGVREHVRAGLKNSKPSGTAVNEKQASDVTLTLNAVTVRPIQTWVRAAGRIDKNGKVLTASVPAPESTFVKVGQRVRAFSPESKSSMFQAWVTKVIPRGDGATLEVTLSGVGHPNSLNYVMEIVTERGEFLSIPNEAIIEEGTRHVVYVQRQGGQYAPVEIETGIQGELYTAVVKGLAEGDQVVSFGSFFVDSEYKLKSSDQPAPSAPSNDQPHH